MAASSCSPRRGRRRRIAIKSLRYSGSNSVGPAMTAAMSRTARAWSARDEAACSLLAAVLAWRAAARAGEARRCSRVIESERVSFPEHLLESTPQPVGAPIRLFAAALGDRERAGDDPKKRLGLRGEGRSIDEGAAAPRACCRRSRHPPYLPRSQAGRDAPRRGSRVRTLDRAPGRGGRGWRPVRTGSGRRLLAGAGRAARVAAAFPLRRDPAPTAARSGGKHASAGRRGRAASASSRATGAPTSAAAPRRRP